MKSMQAHRAARSKVQQTVRRSANEYWQQLSDAIQTAADSGNIRGTCEGIKTVVAFSFSSIELNEVEYECSSAM